MKLIDKKSSHRWFYGEVYFSGEKDQFVEAMAMYGVRVQFNDELGLAKLEPRVGKTMHIPIDFVILLWPDQRLFKAITKEEMFKDYRVEGRRAKDRADHIEPTFKKRFGRGVRRK